MSAIINGKRYPDIVLENNTPCEKCNKIKDKDCHSENCLTYVRWMNHQPIRSL